MRIFGLIMLGVLGIVLLVSISFGATWLGIEWDGFFGARRANVVEDLECRR